MNDLPQTVTEAIEAYGRAMSWLGVDPKGTAAWAAREKARRELNAAIRQYADERVKHSFDGVGGCD